jgi:hypothetical protein
MKSRIAHALLVGATLAAAGCGGGGGSGEPPPPANPPPSSSPPPAAVPFASFVLEQIAATDDTVDPIELNDLDWEFDENETAYDNVL